VPASDRARVSTQEPPSGLPQGRELSPPTKDRLRSGSNRHPPVTAGLAPGCFDAGEHPHRLAERKARRWLRGRSTASNCASVSAQPFVIDLDPIARGSGPDRRNAPVDCSDLGRRETLAFKRHLDLEIQQRLQSQP